jgi:uncharacterized protein (TIGR02217 family)
VLQFEVLRQDATYTELSQLVGFFNARRGQFDSFLYTDPADNAVTAEPFGTGDGATTAFQLTRAFGGAIENVYDLNGATSIYKNAVVQASGYAISAAGVVTFSVAPAAGIALTWSGAYYWRVRFEQDMAEARNFLYQLWNLQQLAFVSVL